MQSACSCCCPPPHGARMKVVSSSTWWPATCNQLLLLVLAPLQLRHHMQGPHSSSGCPCIALNTNIHEDDIAKGMCYSCLVTRVLPHAPTHAPK